MLCKNLETYNLRYFLKALVLGQFISLLLCGTAVSTGLLQQQGVNIPTAQSFFNYVLLCLVFTTILSCRREGRSMCEILRKWGWRYFLIAIVDVEANYLVVKAYAYTTVTSVQLLDCFSLVSVMILSRLFLHARYRIQHLGGAAVCLLGMVGLVLTDVLVGKNDNAASNVALGDVLIIVGATLYGVSNVCQEYVVRTYDKVEFLAMVGLFGSFINGAQFAILERDEVASLDLTSYKIVVPLVVFVICLFLLYSTMTVVIQLTSATTVNLSILSADFYTLLFGLFLFNYKFHVLYFVSFAVIIIGLAIYSTTPTSPALQTGENDSKTSPEFPEQEINYKTSSELPVGTSKSATSLENTVRQESNLDSINTDTGQNEDSVSKTI
ncbi:solute carrier family 35 member F2-like isoform X2 [Mercenaria mercenaria]|uniref:solute carrier family 35 member F2-like isoform X2 n=1 Tax=Mercenaria mercenaria TaxID=6596 RepID=UPI00234E70FB|nr:solute carrier family 35 member F2-like isoform X2 [Mercenaria mercenaria]